MPPWGIVTTSDVVVGGSGEQEYSWYNVDNIEKESADAMEERWVALLLDATSTVGRGHRSL